MKLSKYVNYFKKNEDYIIFHSQLGEACIVDYKIMNILKHINEYNKTKDSNINEIIDEFTKKGILVEEEIDYIYGLTNNRIKNLSTGKQIQTIQLVVSNNCNFKCKYCFENNIYCSKEREKYQNDEHNKIMQSSDAVRYIERVINLVKVENEKRHLHIQFFGGEPLTNLDTIKTVLDTFKNGSDYFIEISYSIVTNGSLINGNIAEYFSKYEVAVIVSFDNPKQIDREMKSGKSSVEKTYEILDILREKEVYVAFNSVLSECTYDYFDTEIVDCAIEHNVKEIGIVLDLNPNFFVDKNYKDIAKKILDIVDYGNTKEIPISGYWMSSYLSTLGHLDCTKGFKTCSGTGSQFSIEPNGTVFACKGSSAYFGHIDDIKGLLDSDSYKKYAARGIQNSIKCENCEIAGFCSGFCLGPLEQTYKDINFVVTPYCDFMKYIIKNLLMRERDISKYEY